MKKLGFVFTIIVLIFAGSSTLYARINSDEYLRYKSGFRFYDEHFVDLDTGGRGQ